MGNTQNIFDNKTFFEGYKEIREREYNYNILLEQPAMKKLLPKVKGKKVLDLGCGYGENCIDFIRDGAVEVLGIDISKKMLEVAKEKNSNPKITYLEGSMEELDGIQGDFDLVYSSLAIHYVEDFKKLSKKVNSLLRKDGIFIFSQSHPLITAPKKGVSWTYGENKEILHYNLSDYAETGERKVEWLVEGVINYHRTFSEIINILIESDFEIEKIVEPKPTKEDIEKIKNLEKDMHKPSFLIIKAKKK